YKVNDLALIVRHPTYHKTPPDQHINDTHKILPSESQVKVIDSSVTVTASSASDYDSVDESLVSSTPLPPLEKLAGVEPIFGPKTIKSILMSNSTFKPETLKGVTINEPTSAPATVNKYVSASKKNLAPASKLKNVKTKDGITLSIYKVNAAEGVNAASEEVSIAELVSTAYMIDYALWEVIENGATLPKTAVVEGVEKVMPITSAEDKAQRRLEVKARTVEKRFGRNATTKKTQRNLLKQQYENFTALSSEMLDQTFDRLQKLMSQLELLDEKLSQEDVNQKLLRSLSPEWNTHAIVDEE
ncbi:hypothetical protein Tco_0879594, partial [Tanacetum coccineum]